MTQKKTTILLSVSLVITLVIAIFYVLKTKNIEQKLSDSENINTELNENMMAYRSLENIDSILVRGEYRGALRAYRKKMENKDLLDVAGVRMRIEIAQQLLQLREGTLSDEEAAARKDSLEALQRGALAATSEIRKYDSLSFALEKAKVQLNTIRRNLQKKSYGQYLTFPSAKGNQMHYVGQVKNKQANGTGVAILDTGSRYEGEWKANMRHGEGSFYWADGEHYEGSYVNDLRNGQGTYYWPNGEKYVGHWKDDKRNGQGTFYSADGEVMTSGIWKEDKLVEPDKN